ncbi:glutamate-cysteine ligase [Neofusicoccum parvum]|uniref:Glutamate-cysteine ligase n=1 Tax=Neofusicoccum parvum TaxID=310453 RepID=A0ACB5SN00_9PEZI|nr:glutamate-cysteine ligase [Neofusicoccum parvum]
MTLTFKQEAVDVWKKGLQKKGFPSLWGDEIEYTLLEVDDATKTVKFCLRSPELLHRLPSEAETGTYTPELVKFQIESQPSRPFSSSVESMLSVEADMASRRAVLKTRLAPNQHALSITTSPRLGSAADTSASLTTSPALLSTGARYRACQHNIVARRGATLPEPYATLPLHVDAHTLSSPTLPPFADPAAAAVRFAAAEMLLGGALCCLQTTFQAADAAAARALHDALVPLAPLLLALTAATPALRGMLVATDVRWGLVAALTDDRTAGERREGRWRARYGAAEGYVAEGVGGRGGGEVARRLEAGGVDAVAAGYLARVVGRVPLVYPVGGLGALRGEVKGEEEVMGSGAGDGGRHVNFDVLHGGLFPSVKLKLPDPGNPELGWRVEFRVMENQISDFENAAFAVVLMLVRLVVERYGVEFYMPMEKVWENMDRAHVRDAVRQQQFWWRVDGEEGKVALLTVGEIFNGCASFKGLMQLVADWMKDEGVSAEERARLQPYLDLVSGRASGRLWTTARFIREFVTQHSRYSGDSQVSEEICYDLVQEMVQITNGKRDSRLFL